MNIEEEFLTEAKTEIIPDKEAEKEVLEQWNKTKEEIVKQSDKEVKGFMAKAEEILKTNNNRGA